MIIDLQLRVKISERVVVELLPVVRDQYSRYAVLADDIPLYKVSYVLQLPPIW